MQTTARLAACVTLVALGSPLYFGQGQLWVVDALGGPGSDFTAIQPAVDAAADGDTVQVRSGAYAGFTIDGKSLVVTGSGLVSIELTFAPLLSVKNLTAAQEVTVRGMQVPGCRLLQNEGPVWLEFLTLKPPPSSCLTWWGVRVEECSAVITSHCSFGGGFLATDGINAVDSSLYLYETDSSGGGKGGAAGVSVTNSFLFASGGTFKGGCGTEGGECSGPGGKGGPGLRRIGGPTPQLLETVLVGGPGGCDLGGCHGCGPPGDPAVGGYDLVAGFARDYNLTSPAVGGQTTTLAYVGKPGDLVFSLIGLSQSMLYVPELAGALVLLIPPILIAHGPAISGQLQVVVTLPPLPAGFEAFTVYAQGAAVSSIGAAVLAAPSQLTIL